MSTLRQPLHTVTCVLALFMFVPIVPAQAPKPLTNDDVIRMVKAGFQNSLVIQAIQANQTAFDTSAAALLVLKDAGATNEVIEAIIKSGSKPASRNEADRLNEARISPPQNEAARSAPQKAAIYVEEVSSDGGIMASSDTTLEAIKSLQKRGMRVVTIKDKADYILQVTRQLGKKSWKKDTKVVLSNREGEVLFSNSTRSVGGAMGDVADYVRRQTE